MESINWRQSFRQRLTDRDEVESKFDDFVHSYSRVAQRALDAELRLSQSQDLEEQDKLHVLEQQLANKTDTLYTLTQEHNTLKKTYLQDKNRIAALEKELIQRQRTLEDYKDEAIKKSGELQSVQDDLLVLQLSLNVSESKVRKLEDENSSLVDRWMRKVAEEADKMNDANAFLKSVGKYH